jgi:hypothetical protein
MPFCFKAVEYHNQISKNVKSEALTGSLYKLLIVNSMYVAVYKSFPSEGFQEPHQASVKLNGRIPCGKFNISCNNKRDELHGLNRIKL